MRRILLLSGFCFIALGLLACADDNRPGEKAEIPASDVSITFFGGTYGPVVFPHERHSTEFFDGVCLACHDHEDVSGATHWSCRDCHTAGQDREDLCDTVDQYHGCIMTQCQNCHDMQPEDSNAPSGSSCYLPSGGCHM